MGSNRNARVFNLARFLTINRCLQTRKKRSGQTAWREGQKGPQRSGLTIGLKRTAFVGGMCALFLVLNAAMPHCGAARGSPVDPNYLFLIEFFVFSFVFLAFAIHQWWSVRPKKSEPPPETASPESPRHPEGEHRLDDGGPKAIER